MTTVLAVDLGSASGRVLAGTFADGRVEVADVHRFKHQALRDGARLTWDVETMWEQTVIGLREAVEAHPDAVVIQLGAGIDARYDRLGRPAVTHWYDLDLPEAIDLRRRLLPETERNTYLAMSLLDFRWIDTVHAHGRPVLLILEGVLMYFTEAEVRSFFDAICRDLPDGTTILFDMLAYSLVNNAKHHDVVKKADKTVEFKWSVLDTHEMERWNPRIHLVREYYMSDHARGRFPFIFRTLYHIPYFHRRFNPDGAAAVRGGGAVGPRPFRRGGAWAGGSRCGPEGSRP